MSSATIPVTGDAEADQLLVDDPLALLIGMLLDQQVPMEWAFRGPLTLKARLGVERLDAKAIAAMNPAEVESIFRSKPAMHRYPGSMAQRTHALCVHIADEYGGDAAAVWEGAGTAQELYTRLRALPGYGDDKTKIFMAILGKRLAKAPEGWEAVAAPFSDTQPRSVADVDGPDALQRVRAWKQAHKAAKKVKAE